METEYYLYASVPPNMQGTRLVSRNGLAALNPALAADAARKYVGREGVRDMYILGLDCHWADLIFLTPYDPEKTSEHLMNAGHTPRPQRFFKIPLSRIKTSGLEAYWLDTTRPHTVIGECIYPFEFEKFTTPDLPQQQIDEYQNAKRDGRNPLLYGRAPHMFLVAKNREHETEPPGIDLSDCEIITVDVMGKRSAPRQL
jgi:hypothetical protein